MKARTIIAQYVKEMRKKYKLTSLRRLEWGYTSSICIMISHNLLNKSLL